MADGGEVHILDMGQPVKILDLAKQDPLKTASLIRNWLRDTR